MKPGMGLLVGVMVCAFGCDDSASRRYASAPRTGQMQTGEDPRAVYERHMKRTDEQLDWGEEQLSKGDELLRKLDEQQSKADEQNARFDAILDKWEEQARRYDAILDSWEKMAQPQKQES